MDEERIYIGRASELLDRRAATIRGWERQEVLPETLRSHRDEKGWRYWLPEQIEAIKDWIVENDRRPGKGLAHYKPSLEKVASHIAKTRGPRTTDDVG